LLFLVPKDRKFEAYARILMAGLTAYLLAKLLASVYQPSGERPFQILGVAPSASYLNNPGFPSDHALFTAFLTLAVWFETKRKGIAIALAVLTLCVCVGRVLALVHTPLDVIGGLVIASVGALWYFQQGVTKTSPLAKKTKS
jgi:membrane-associated phospholipid phosphatase